ncbi:MAG TPA: hypothetical protein VN670_06470 [Acidobacteriaceae bacterium]|nr:hypothetical protein [Acidobacteriaceae bacterium]
MKSSDQIREYAGKQFVEPALHGAGTTVSIKSGDIVRGMGLKNKTPNVCTALRSKIFQNQYGLQLIGEQGPPSGMSTTVVFTYRVLKPGQAKGTESVPSKFDQLRGIAKTLFKNPGDWERSIQSDRRNFYGKTGAKRAGKRG